MHDEATRPQEETMTVFRAFKKSPQPTTDGDHEVTMDGCDGQRHAHWTAEVSFENGQGVAGQVLGTTITGPCDGTCRGHLSQRSGFMYP